MTKKRFILDDDEIVVDTVDLSMYIDNEDCCEKMNELNDENKKLKEEIKQLEDEIELLEGKLWNCKHFNR